MSIPEVSKNFKFSIISLKITLFLKNYLLSVLKRENKNILSNVAKSGGRQAREYILHQTFVLLHAIHGLFTSKSL